jgi:hypothetical protein
VMTTPRRGAGRPTWVIRATGRACRSGIPMVGPLVSVGTIQRAAPTRKAPAVYPAAAHGAPSACRRAPESVRGPVASRQELRSNAMPRSRSETKPSPATMRWSSSCMSRSLPAARASAVRRRSSGLGVVSAQCRILGKSRNRFYASNRADGRLGGLGRVPSERQSSAPSPRRCAIDRPLVSGDKWRISVR